MITLDLGGAWEFRAAIDSDTIPESCKRATDWLPAMVPGTVHTDLMANGVIPDPSFRMNENAVQWVDKQQWVYRRSFEVPEEVLREKKVLLKANGLDTYATVSINGRKVGSSDNMFIDHEFNVRRTLKSGTNSIEILFDSPVLRAMALEKKHGPLEVALEPHRVYVRKAQYSFSWDWGPKLTTSGIWRSISLEAYSGGKLRSPFAQVVTLRSDAATVKLDVEIEGNGGGRDAVKFVVTDGETRLEAAGQVKRGNASATVRIPHPQLWWPNGQGDQPMYSATATLIRGDEEIDAIEFRFAVRTVRLMQEKDAEGKSFVFVINGRKVFCKGADWIPADNFLPRIEDSRYEQLLLLAKKAHMNMIRVWGGGIYEDDRFYDLCDRLGILVWQDFMFACGEYPDDRWFLDSVQEEAERTIKRLRNHPSIALWCGNNECEWLFCTQNPGKSPDRMSGAKIFREVLPAACKAFDGTRPYWRSSPFGTGFPNDESNGNHHQWQVWSAWKDFGVYEQDCARFVTEFGFQAPANLRTMEECTLPEDRHPQSAVMEHHNKQVEGPERLVRFISGHFRLDMDLPKFTYYGQLVQAEALKCAVEHWRRRKFATAGALFWQLNDCWPVTSWSVVDSSLRPKAGYYFAKRFFAPVLVSFTRTDMGVQVWLTSDVPTPVTGKITVSRRSLDGAVVWTRGADCHFQSNSSRAVMPLEEGSLDNLSPSTEYLLAEWQDEQGNSSANRYFFAEPKHLATSDPALSWDIQHNGGDGYSVEIHAARYVRCVHLFLDGDDAEFDDNYVEIDAGSTKSVRFHTAMSPGIVRERLTLQWEY